MINFQHPAFPDLTNFCYKHLYTKPLSPFRAVHSYSTRDNGTGQQNYLKLLYTEILSSKVCFRFIFSYLSVTCWHLFITSRYTLCLHFWIALVMTRISINQGSVPYIWLQFWPGWRKLFIIQRFIKSKFHCNCLLFCISKFSRILKFHITSEEKESSGCIPLLLLKFLNHFLFCEKKTEHG